MLDANAGHDLYSLSFMFLAQITYTLCYDNFEESSVFTTNTEIKRSEYQLICLIMKD